MAAVDIETPEQKRQKLATLAKVMNRPGVAAAYGADPRTGIAQGLIRTGGDTSPTQGGWAEGLTRLASGLAGGYIGKQQRDKWQAKDDEATAKLVAALQGGGVIGDQVSSGVAAGLDPETAALMAQNPAPQVGTGQADRLAAIGGPPVPGATPPPAPGMPPVPGAMAAPKLVGAPQQPNFPQAPAGANPLSAATIPQPANATAVPTRQPQVGTGGAVADFDKFDSPAYEPIEAAMERKHGIPPGTLKRLRMAERSNANQVSETGARTVYQFVPGTRRNFKRKYGVDAWAGPRQSVEAAALHIKESLARGKDMEGALRDYRGVDESADPGWYARARGESGAASGGGGGGMAVGQPATPPPVEIPDLPAAPVAPERPASREKIQSARMAIVKNLLGSGGDINDIGVLLNEFLPEGLNEEQKSREAEYEAQGQLDNIQYQSQLSGFNQLTSNLQEGQITARNKAIDQQYQQINDAYRESNSNFRNSQDNIAAMARQEAGDKAATERAKITDNNPAVWAGKEQFKLTTQVQDADNALSLLSQIPDAVGLKYSIGDIASQRLDPNGEKVRAAVANFAGLLLHGISGAAVTPAEYERNRAWLPSPNDTAAAVRTKINFIRSQSQRNLGTLGSLGLVAGGAAPAALPAGVTVTVEK